MLKYFSTHGFTRPAPFPPQGPKEILKRDQSCHEQSEQHDVADNHNDADNHNVEQSEQHDVADNHNDAGKNAEKSEQARVDDVE
jgi:hypothetical protein